MYNSLMIVDDNEQIRDSVAILFESLNYKVVCAESGLECIKQLESGFRGVILMDVMMPELDGWDTIRKIVECGLYEGNLLAMLTAQDEPDYKMDGLQEFVTDYITKPFTPQQLVKSVEYLEQLVKDAGRL